MNHYHRLLLGGITLIAALGITANASSSRNPFAVPSSGNPYPAGSDAFHQYTPPTAPADPHGRWYLEQRKSPNRVETFRVSRVGADKTMLLRVFQAVKDAEETKTKYGKKGRNSFRVMQRLSPTEFLVHQTETYYDPNPFARARSSNRTGAATATASFRAGKSQVFLLKTQQPLNAVDGEWIRGITVNDTGAVHTYTATLGNLKSVRILTEDAPLNSQHTFTQEEFVDRLRNGETWTLKNFEEEDCRVCFGRGELSTFKGGGACPQCGDTAHKGKGFIDYLIRW